MVVPGAYFPCTSKHEYSCVMVLEIRLLHADHSDSNDDSSMFYMHHWERAECCNAGKAAVAEVESGRCRMNTGYVRRVYIRRIVEETAYPANAARGTECVHETC